MHQALHHVVINIGEKRPDHVFDLVESLGAEEHRLVVRDVVCLNTHPADVQRPEFGHFDLLEDDDEGAVGQESRPAPYVRTSPCSRTTPNSKENQKTFETNSSASVVCTRRAACPASRYRVAKQS